MVIKVRNFMSSGKFGKKLNLVCDKWTNKINKYSGLKIRWFSVNT